ncbi:MAG: undecaprenyl-diphosphate phosphatase [Verrucomicrobiota bacterium]
MSNWIATVILGIVEGITEFLPVSSTGHLLIVEHFCDWRRSEFFNVGIQAGAVLAVILVYWKRLFELFKNWNQPQNKKFILQCAAAFGITVVFGLGARKLGFKLDDANTWAVTGAVIVGALLIFYSEKRLSSHASSEDIAWSTAILVGAAQVLAGIFPGTSRSAATIIAAMLMGTSRVAATEFSFLLGIPTMFAASGYLLLKEVKDRGAPPFSEIQHFILGFLVSMVVAFIAVKWLLHYIRSHTFIPFAWYRLGLGIILIILLTKV